MKMAYRLSGFVSILMTVLYPIAGPISSVLDRWLGGQHSFKRYTREEVSTSTREAFSGWMRVWMDGWMQYPFIPPLQSSQSHHPFLSYPFNQPNTHKTHRSRRSWSCSARTSRIKPAAATARPPAGAALPVARAGAMGTSRRWARRTTTTGRRSWKGAGAGAGAGSMAGGSGPSRWTRRRSWRACSSATASAWRTPTSPWTRCASVRAYV